MKQVISTCLTIAALALFQFNALGWGSAGHMVIAAEAFRALSPTQQAQIYDTLKAHPNFAKWTNSYHANGNVDLPSYVFMRSSTWADEIRRTENPYDHPNWHFIDYPIRPPQFPMEPDARPTDNVLYGISQCEKVLGDTNASPELRAVHLAWLVHLIGDLHQPLHCESYFTAEYPEGDKGGNDFFVKPAKSGIRLHGLWDGLLGSAADAQALWKYAVTLDTATSRAQLPELKTHTTPKEWSLEGRELAIDKGYLHGDLPGSKEASNAPALPPGYTPAAKAVAEHQAVLAGYRLADELQAALKYNGEAPALPAKSAPTASSAPQKIGIAAAKNYYNETMTVTGRVVQVSERPTITFINLDQAGPAAPLSIVIFPDNHDKFGDLQKLKNQPVEVTGTIVEFHDKPEIILESAEQIKVVKP